MMSDAGPEATFVTGGTDLYPNMKRRQQTPKVVIGLAQLKELCTTKGKPTEGMVLGAGLTLTEVVEDRSIQDAYPAVAKAAELISTPLLRNMGSIGGNLLLDTRCNYYNQNYEWRKASQLLHEEGWRHLLGGSFQPALLGGAVERFRSGDGGHRREE